MQFLLIVLNKVELLETLLENLFECGIGGATIINSTGMAKEIVAKNKDYPIFGSLRYLINLDRKESKTIFMVLKDEQVEDTKALIRQVVGDMSKPDTAIMFTMPVLSIEGVHDQS